MTETIEKTDSEECRAKRTVSNLRVVSFGGGVNSTALLIGMQERGERPDAILFADTGGEMPATYKHISDVGVWCNQNGFPEPQLVRYHESRHGTLETECLNNETLPSKAFGFSGCSVKWKRQPMDRWLSAWEPAKAAWERGELVQRLIGIHYGETRRGRIPNDERYAYVYPLREWKWAQEECEAAHTRAGLRLPCKSACFFCPAMRKVEVIQLAKDHPDLFERAVAIERNAIAAGSLETVRGLGRHWTWEALVAADSKQQRLFEDNQSPLCDVCLDD